MYPRTIARVTIVVAAASAASMFLSTGSFAQDAYYYRKGTFAMGGGINSAVGETAPYLNSSGTIYFAGGRNFGRKAALEVEYTHNWLSVDPEVIDRAASDSSQIEEAHASLWSVTLNGKYRFGHAPDLAPWVTVGGGFYKRNVLLTQSALVYYPPIFDPWWGWIDGGWGTGEAIIGQHSASAFGFNAGFGIDFGIENGTKLFLDARYHYVNMDGVNMQIIPVMAGFRW